MNEAKLNEFMGKLVTDMGGAAMIASVILGEELGLYRAMAGCDPHDARAACGADESSPAADPGMAERPGGGRYVEASDGRFRLPEEQAMALANEDSPVYVAGGASVLVSMFLDKDKLVAAMRGNGGLSWGEAPSRVCFRARSASSGPATALT